MWSVCCGKLSLSHMCAVISVVDRLDTVHTKINVTLMELRSWSESLRMRANSSVDRVSWIGNVM